VIRDIVTLGFKVQPYLEERALLQKDRSYQFRRSGACQTRVPDMCVWATVGLRLIYA
jgi:hypothetical protein